MKALVNIRFFVSLTTQISVVMVFRQFFCTKQGWWVLIYLCNIFIDTIRIVFSIQCCGYEVFAWLHDIVMISENYKPVWCCGGIFINHTGEFFPGTCMLTNRHTDRWADWHSLTCTHTNTDMYAFLNLPACLIDQTQTDRQRDRHQRMKIYNLCTIMFKQCAHA